MVPAGLLMAGLRTAHARTPALNQSIFVSRHFRPARPPRTCLDPNIDPFRAPHGLSLSRSFLTPSAQPLLQTHLSCHGQCRQHAPAAQDPTHTLTAITIQRARAPLVRALRGAKASGCPCCLCSPAIGRASPAPPTRHGLCSPIRQ